MTHLAAKLGKKINASRNAYTHMTDSEFRPILKEIIKESLDYGDLLREVRTDKAVFLFMSDLSVLFMGESDKGLLSPEDATQLLAHYYPFSDCTFRKDRDTTEH